MRFFLIGLIALAGMQNVQAQTMIHPKFGGLGYHGFETPNRVLYENALHANKQWVVEPAVMVSVETYLRGTQLSWRFMPGFYVDAAAQPAMFFHAGLKLRILQIFRSSFDIAAGPRTISGRTGTNTIITPKKATGT